jgi:hypothetical protein
MSKIEVDAITEQSGSTLTVGGGASKTVVADATTVTLGRCGGTVALASGATQSGFGRTGTVDWQTGSIKTSTFTAANGEGYFANTSGGAFTMNLPAGTAGNIVSVVDYTNTFQTNALTIAPNGSEKIGGIASTFVADVEGQSLTFVYVDGTEGWKNVQDSTSNATGNPFIVATVSGSGNTLATAPCCANAKIATFTGPGDFTVSQVHPCAANNVVSYMVVGGGGGGGGAEGGGGGGSGGFREGKSPVTPYTASPLVAPTGLTVTAATFPITVGGGGAAGVAPSAPTRATSGNNSIFSTITSAGGGGGGGGCGTAPNRPGIAGGSGGGGGEYRGCAPGGVGSGGGGNVPPVSPSQGNSGAAGNPNATNPAGAGGGGGAGAAGTAGQPNGGGAGGAGVTTSISGTPTARAGGGGGGVYGPAPQGAGGTGGGGTGGQGLPNIAGVVGTINTGGGGGGGGNGCAPPLPNSADGAAGGSGIVIIRYKFK